MGRPTAVACGWQLLLRRLRWVVQKLLEGRDRPRALAPAVCVPAALGVPPLPSVGLQAV